MPSFSLGNPLQALYLKKRGVEKLLARMSCNTMNADFAKKTERRIEKQSMLIKRTAPIATGYDDNSNEWKFPIVLETILSTADSEMREGAQDEIVSELSRYDEASSASAETFDWSLPGVEDEKTDIRYDFRDTDFYDLELRQKKKEAANREARELADSTDKMESISASYMCGYLTKCL
eukprot:jgi/Psemu1/300707/fgenesh1_kg.16_\